MSQHIWIRFRIWIGIPHHFRLYKKTLDVGIDGGAQSCPLCGHSLMYFFILPLYSEQECRYCETKLASIVRLSSHTTRTARRGGCQSTEH